MNTKIEEVLLVPKGKKRTAPFLRGPIPVAWLEKAGKLPGKALHIGISLWFLRGVTKSDTFPFNQNRQERYGVKRDAARRGMNALLNAGLITMKAMPGRRLLVTIVSNDEAAATPAVCSVHHEIQNPTESERPSAVVNSQESRI